MTELSSILTRIFQDEIYQCMISQPVASPDPYEKIAVRRRENGYQLEKYTKTQVFHEHVPIQSVVTTIQEMLEASFRQLNAWSETHEYGVRISKKGKLLYSSRPVTAAVPKKGLEHNREKRYLLTEGEVIEPLVDMGVMTSEGTVIRTMYNKYRQINRFLEIVDDEVKKMDISRAISIVDLCCGKSYLTFVLYHYLTKIKGIKVNMLGLDLKESVIDKCNITAAKYGYDCLTFQVQDINTYQFAGDIDLVIALHACDTATDSVLFNAVRWQAKLIFSVPCCQHELNGQMKSESILTRYGIVQERVAALMTDAIRANLLEICGYRTQLLEFIDLEHTPKNILIRAVRTNRKGNPALMEEVEVLMNQFNFSPTLYRLLKQAGMI